MHGAGWDRCGWIDTAVVNEMDYGDNPDEMTVQDPETIGANGAADGSAGGAAGAAGDATTVDSSATDVAAGDVDPNAATTEEVVWDYEGHDLPQDQNTVRFCMHPEMCDTEVDEGDDM